MKRAGNIVACRYALSVRDVSRQTRTSDRIVGQEGLIKKEERKEGSASR
jgi:hypothetical protein